MAQTILELAPFDLRTMTPDERAHRAATLALLFAALDRDFRLFAQTRPLSLTPVTRDLEQTLSRTSEPWRRQGLAQYKRWVEQKVKGASLKEGRYFLVLPDARQDPATAARAVSAAMRTSATVAATLPPVFQGEFDEYPTYLAPRTPNQPFVTFLTSYEFRGSIDFDTLGELVRLDLPLALCVDVKTTPKVEVMERLEKTSRELRVDMMGHGALGRVDMAQQEAHQEVLRAMRAAKQFLLHEVTLLVALSAPTQEELRQQVELVKVTARQQGIELRVGTCIQAQLARAWEGGEIYRVRRHNMMSDGVAFLMPAVVRYRTRLAGIVVGVERASNTLITLDRFDQDEFPAPHAVVMGGTGGGKSYTVFAWMYRGVLMGEHNILIDPQRMGQGITEACHGSYNRLDVQGGTHLNPLDLVEEKAPGQITHVLAILELLIGRALTTQERAGVDRALMPLYGGLDLDSPLERMPRLNGLRDALKGVERDFEVRRLVSDLSLFIEGSMGQIFNQPTSVDLRLERPLVTFDLMQTEGPYQGLFIYTLLAAIAREMQRGRETMRRGNIVIDEFGILARNPEIRVRVVELFKRLRSFGKAVIAIDQQPATFLAFPDIIENAHTRVFLRMDEGGVRALRQVYTVLRSDISHILLGADPKQGEQILWAGRDLYHINNELSASELAMMRPSVASRRP